jgi:hypothetical protein
MTDKALKSIQSQPMMSFLQKLGFNKHFPRAATFGPHEMGGLAMRNLPIEQGIAQIMTFLEHVYNNTEPGRLICIALHTLQLEAGTRDLLLAEPTQSLTYLTPTWLTAL